MLCLFDSQPLSGVPSAVGDDWVDELPLDVSSFFLRRLNDAARTILARPPDFGRPEVSGSSSSNAPRALPRRFKVDIVVSPGSHSSEAAVNKQLNDKERVAAALENPNLLEKVDLCLSGQTAM